MEPSPIAVESLLAHRPWVRGLARVLAAGPADADDLEQEAWLAGIRRGGDPPDSPRGWLASVLRRQAARAHRGAARRGRRERAASRDEALPSAAEVVERTETHRRLVDAVLSLAEPYRTTVLLRFFDDLAPREVAERMGAPVETVRSRLRRALLDLRARFEREAAGGRRPWRAAFLLLAHEGRVGPPGADAALGAAAVAKGAAVATTATKAGWAAAVILALGAATWLVLRDGVGADRTTEAPPHEEAAVPGAQGPALAAHPGLAADAAADRGPGPAPIPDPPSPDAPAVRVVASGPEARAVAGARIEAHYARKDGGAEVFEGFADATGRATLPEHALGAAVLWVSAPGHASVRRAGVTLAAGGEERVVLDRGGAVTLAYVEMGTGRPLPAEEMRAAFARTGVPPTVELVWDGALTSSDLAQLFRTMFDAPGTWRRPTTVAWEDGTARLGERLGEGTWRLLVWTPDGTPVLSDPFRASGGDLVATVPVPPESRPRRVRVVDRESRAPLAGARLRSFLEYGDDQAFFPGPVRVADANGEADVPPPPPGVPGHGKTTTQRPPVWWVESEDHAARLVEHELSRAGDGPIEVPVDRTATVAGAAWTSEGAPARGLTVAAHDKGRVLRTVVGADGRYRLTAVASRPAGGRANLALVEDLDGGRLGMAEVATRPGETTEVDIGTPASAGARASVEGVVTAGGKPLVGVFAMAKGDGEGAGNAVPTDAAGRFRLAALAPGRTRMRLFVSDPRVSDDFYLAPAEDLVLAPGDARSYTLALPGGAFRVRVVDATTGEPILGAAAMARPEEREADAAVVPGWTWRPGAAAFVGEDGAALLLPLPTNAAHEVAAHAAGYAEGRSQGHLPGTRDAPAEVTIRLTKRP